MSINSLTRKLNKERDKEIWQTESKKKIQRHPSQQNISLETRNRFTSLQKNQDEVLDKENEISEHCQ